MSSADSEAKKRKNSQRIFDPKIKEYECPMSDCRKRFTEKGNMKVHVRTHTGEKPFICRICAKKFNCFGNCRDHERRHNKIKYDLSNIYVK